MAAGRDIPAVMSHVVMVCRSVHEDVKILRLNMVEIIVLVLDRQKNYEDASLSHALVMIYFNFICFSLLYKISQNACNACCSEILLLPNPLLRSIKNTIHRFNTFNSITYATG